MMNLTRVKKICLILHVFDNNDSETLINVKMNVSDRVEVNLNGLNMNI